jgi:hypothetical protein
LACLCTAAFRTPQCKDDKGERQRLRYVITAAAEVPADANAVIMLNESKD